MASKCWLSLHDGWHSSHFPSEPEIPESTADDEADKNSADEGALEGDDLVMQRVPSPDGGAASTAESRADEGSAQPIGNGEVTQTNPETGEEAAVVPVEGTEGAASEEGGAEEATPLPPATVSFADST